VSPVVRASAIKALRIAVRALQQLALLGEMRRGFRAILLGLLQCVLERLLASRHGSRDRAEGVFRQDHEQDDEDHQRPDHEAAVRRQDVAARATLLRNTAAPLHPPIAATTPEPTTTIRRM